MRLSVRQLECLVAVADTLHFGRAAERLHVTQPALSAQVQQAEELLGAPVFERGGRRVVSTALGERVVEQARTALREIDAVSDVARAAREPLSGPLRLGVIPTIAPYLLPSRLPAVRKAHPRLQLILREDKTDALLRQLEERRLDLLLLALPVEGRDLEQLPLRDEPFVFVARSDHPLAKPRGRRLAESDLAAAEVLLLEDGHCLRDQALSVCERAGGHEASRSLRATSLGTLVQMVANGLGATLLPESAVEVELRPDLDMVIRRFRSPEPGRTLGLVWRRGSPRREEFEALGALLVPPARKRGPRRRRGSQQARRAGGASRVPRGGR